MKNEVVLSVSEPKKLTWYVNVYEVYRAYSGPQEGGWFYDEGTLRESKAFEYYDDNGEHYQQYENAIAHAKEWEEALAEEELAYALGQGEHDGVDSDGNGDDHYLLRGGSWGEGKYLIEVTTEEGADYPTERPTYS